MRGIAHSTREEHLVSEFGTSEFQMEPSAGMEGKFQSMTDLEWLKILPSCYSGPDVTLDTAPPLPFPILPLNGLPSIIDG